MRGQYRIYREQLVLQAILIHVLNYACYKILERMWREERNQISFIGLVSRKDYYKRPSKVIYKKRSCRCEFLSEVKCAEEMCCGRGGLIWVQLGTRTTSLRPAYLGRQFIQQCEQHDSRIRADDGGYNISVGEANR